MAGAVLQLGGGREVKGDRGEVDGDRGGGVVVVVVVKSG